MVTDKSLDEKELWEVIKNIRYEYVKKNTDFNCYDGEFIPEQDQVLNIEKLSKMLKIHNLSEEINKNLTKSTFDTGVKMFVALNSCPSDYVSVYNKIFFGPQSRLALSSYNMITKAKKGFRSTALKIFTKVISVLNFKYIQQQSKGLTSNDNIELEKDVSKIKGKTVFNGHLLIF